MGWVHKSGAAATFQSGTGGLQLEVVAGTSYAVGDLILVVISAGTNSGTIDVSSVTDNLGNTYSPLTNGHIQYNANNGGGSQSAVGAVYAAINVAAGTPNIIVNVTHSSNWGCCVLTDGFTGSGAITDVTATIAQGSAVTNPASNTTAATTNGNELGLAIYVDLGGGAPNQPPSGYTAGAQISGSQNNNGLIAYKDSGAIGSTLSAGNPITGGGSPGEPWAFFVVVLQIAPVSVAEAGTITDSASVSQASSTTPQVSDLATVTDRAQVQIAGDPVLPTGFGQKVAPSWSTWQPTPGRYTFYFANFATNIISMTLPLTEVVFTNLINRAGSFTAKLDMADRSLWAVPDPVAAINATIPEQSVIYIDKGGQIVWSGSILTRHYDLPTDTLTLGGQDFWYWFSKVAVKDNLSYNEDMMQIQRDLVTYAQSQPNAKYGITFDNAMLSGNVVTRNYTNANSPQMSVGKLCEELAALNPGFEFRVRSSWVGQSPVRKLQQAYPRFGLSALGTNLVWGYPGGAIEQFTWAEDGTATARRVIAMGNQQTSGIRPIAVSSLTPAFPLTDEVVSYSVDGVNDLQPLADAEQALKANPITIPDVVVYGYTDPLFGTYKEGDHARYKVRANTSGRFWGGMDTVWRIIGISVAIQSDGTEKVTHMLAPAAF